MRVIVMHRNNAEIRAEAPPRKALIEGMGELVGGLVRTGKLVDAAGLLPRGRTRVRRTAGATALQTDPPGENELPASFVMVKVDTMPKAIGWAKRLTAAAGPDAEVEVGPVTEAWD